MMVIVGFIAAQKIALGAHEGCLAARAAARLVPFNGSAQTFFERHLRFEAKLLARARNVQAPPRLSIRLVRAPTYLAGESCQPRDRLCQLSNGYLGTRADIHWSVVVVDCGSAHHGVSAVGHIKKFARGFSRSPGFDE